MKLLRVTKAEADQIVEKFAAAYCKKHDTGFFKAAAACPDAGISEDTFSKLKNRKIKRCDVFTLKAIALYIGEPLVDLVQEAKDIQRSNEPANGRIYLNLADKKDFRIEEILREPLPTETGKKETALNDKWWVPDKSGNVNLRMIHTWLASDFESKSAHPDRGIQDIESDDAYLKIKCQRLQAWAKIFESWNSNPESAHRGSCNKFKLNIYVLLPCSEAFIQSRMLYRDSTIGGTVEDRIDYAKEKIKETGEGFLAMKKALDEKVGGGWCNIEVRLYRHFQPGPVYLMSNTRLLLGVYDDIFSSNECPFHELKMSNAFGNYHSNRFDRIWHRNRDKQYHGGTIKWRQ